jgi:hypothetical protein
MLVTDSPTVKNWTVETYTAVDAKIQMSSLAVSIKSCLLDRTALTPNLVWVRRPQILYWPLMIGTYLESPIS